MSCTCCVGQNVECDGTEECVKADEEDLQKKRLEKKRKLRELFDEQYDDGDATHLDVLKEEVQKQGEVRDQPLKTIKPLSLIHLKEMILFLPPPPFSSTGQSLRIWMMIRGCNMKASGQECTSEWKSPRYRASLSATSIPTIPLSSEAWALVRAVLGTCR